MRLLISSIFMLACVGCATKLPEAQSDMRAIYDGSDATSAVQSIDRAVANADIDLTGYTRTSASEINTRFARLPNPTLAMYVFPHLAGELPVPGYITTFSLWDVAPFALPGEVVGEEVIDP